jgi:hypothetical protein
LSAALQRHLVTPDRARSHLILFLSNLNTIEGHARQNATPEGHPLGVRLTGNLDADLAALLEWKGGPPWPWEQMLRAIRVHRHVLRSVYCLCSRESLPQVMNFRHLLDYYQLLSGCQFWIVTQNSELGEYHAREERDDSGLDFENYDQLVAVLASVLQKLRAKGIPESSIMVDFTGGQKVTSVAAVAATFNLKISAQYVQTGPPKDVYAYDVVLEEPRLDVPLK